MARGRIISVTLGRSRKFNRLSDHFAKLVYIHTLTSADEQGRIEADTIAIYGDHFVADPEVSLERIEAALIEMHHVGLIQLYDVDGKRYAEFVDFEVHNTIRRYKDGEKAGQPMREGVSRIPARPSDSAPSTPDRAESAQKPRSGRAETAYEVEVEVKDQDQDQEQAEVLAQARETDRADEDSPEARFTRLANTGQSDQHETARARAVIRRLTGAKFASENEASMLSWSRHTTDRLTALWHASAPQLWPGEAGKRRSWLFTDLLNEERYPPGEQREPERRYDQPITGADLLDDDGSLEGNWKN